MSFGRLSVLASKLFGKKNYTLIVQAIGYPRILPISNLINLIYC